MAKLVFLPTDADGMGDDVTPEVAAPKHALTKAREMGGSEQFKRLKRWRRPRSCQHLPQSRLASSHLLPAPRFAGRVSLSVESYLRSDLEQVASELSAGGAVRDVHDRLVLRPSNGVTEASDYLTRKHDWVQMEEEETPQLRRALWVPDGGAPGWVGGTRVEL